MLGFRVKWLVGLFAMACFLMVGLVIFKRQAYLSWKQMLDGPFYGTNYVGEITGEPVSFLMLPTGGSLEVHRLRESGEFVLSHRLATVSNAWSRLLLAEHIMEDGSKRRTEFREFNLRSVRQSKSGFEVLVIGEWYPGGKEKGLVLLEPDFSFRAFYLDW